MDISDLEKQWEKEIRTILDNQMKNSDITVPELRELVEQCKEVLIKDYVVKAKAAYVEQEQELVKLRKRINKRQNK